MYSDPYQKLSHFIILQAVKDFKPAYNRLKKYPNDRWAKDRVREVTEFFNSDYFDSLTRMDGPWLLRQLKKKLDEEYERSRRRR